MKKALSLLVVLIMILSCCACKDSGGKKPTDNTSSSSSDTNTGGKGKSGSKKSDDTDTDGSDSTVTRTATSDVEKTITEIDEETVIDKVVTKEAVKGKDAYIEYGDSDEYYEDIEYDASIKYPEVTPEYGTAPATIKTKWDASSVQKKAFSDTETKKLRNKILNAANTSKNYKITGTTYYVSPNGSDDNDGKSPKKAFKTVNASIFTMTDMLKPGDAVLFERNGLWRLTSSIKCRKGVTYGSYGKGEKPTFYCSLRNYANKDYWKPSNKQYIWKLTVADNDIGIVVCNNGELVGVKKLNGIVALEKNGDFYFNKNQDALYFYYDKGNPGKMFKDIEVGLNKNAFIVERAENVTIDNLRIKYSGRFGISMGDCDGSTVTNCEIGFIGGVLQSGTTRLGNGIQVWNGVKNHTVKNCWLYQIYDAAITFQGDNEYKEGFLRNLADNDYYKNINYIDNLIEYSTYSIEFWHANTEMNGTVHDRESIARLEDITISGNISRFAGFGWGRQRTDHMGNHICVWRRAFPNAKRNKIVNNIFDQADSYIVYWEFKDGANNGDWTVKDNTYYHGNNTYNEGIDFGYQSIITNITDLTSAIKRFDKAPKSIVWAE